MIYHRAIVTDLMLQSSIKPVGEPSQKREWGPALAKIMHEIFKSV